MRLYLKMILQIGLLWLIFQAGNLGVSFLKLPLPGNVLGMLLLFGLLATGIIPVTWVEEGAGILLKHLAFFFIPIAVGLMAWTSLFDAVGLWILAALLVSSILAIALTGGVVQLLNRKERGEQS